MSIHGSGSVSQSFGNGLSGAISGNSGSGATSNLDSGANGYQAAAQQANSQAEASSFEDSQIQLQHSIDDKAIGAFPTSA